MTDTTASAWGMCAAFGCPLLGTQSIGDNAWFCFCHIGRSTRANDEITHTLRTQWQDVVDMTLALRRDHSIRGDSATAATSLPTPAAAGTPGFFTEGSQASPTWPTAPTT
jgi:hypothetical protein